MNGDNNYIDNSQGFNNQNPNRQINNSSNKAPYIIIVFIVLGFVMIFAAGFFIYELIDFSSSSKTDKFDPIEPSLSETIKKTNIFDDQEPSQGENIDFESKFKEIKNLRKDFDSFMTYKSHTIYNDKLFISGFSNSILTFDGTNWNEYHTNLSSLEKMEVYNDKLYGYRNKKLYVYDDSSNEWTEIYSFNLTGHVLSGMESTDRGLYITFTYKNEVYIYDGNSMNIINTCSPKGFVSALATIQGNLYAAVWECENKIYKIDKDSWIPIANMEGNPRDMVSYNNKLIVRGSYDLYEYQKKFKHLFFDRDLFFTESIFVFNNELIIYYKNNILIYNGQTFKIDRYFNKRPNAFIVYKENLYFPTFFGEFYIYEP